MLSKEVGRITVVTTDLKGFSQESLDLAKRLENCYCQKAPWKNYRYDDIQITKEENPEMVIRNTQQIADNDYVEYIVIDDIHKQITWGQGDFAVTCKLSDLEVIELDRWEDDGDIRIGVKPEGVLILDDFEISIYRTNKEGYIGEYVKITEDNQHLINGPCTDKFVFNGKGIGGHEQWGAIMQDPLITYKKEVIENDFMELDEAINCLQRVYPLIGKNDQDSWLKTMEYKDREDFERETGTVLSNFNWGLCGEPDPEKEDYYRDNAEGLTYFKTAEVMFIFGDSSGDRAYTATKAILTDGNRNYWCNGEV